MAVATTTVAATTGTVAGGAPAIMGLTCLWESRFSTPDITVVDTGTDTDMATDTTTDADTMADTDTMAAMAATAATAITDKVSPKREAFRLENYSRHPALRDERLISLVRLS